MVITSIRIHARPEKKKEILQAITDLSKQIMMNKGCVKSSLYQDMEDSDSFYIIEEWKSFEDLEEHKKSKEFSILRGLNSMLAESLDIRYAKRL